MPPGALPIYCQVQKLMVHAQIRVRRALHNFTSPQNKIEEKNRVQTSLAVAIPNNAVLRSVAVRYCHITEGNMGSRHKHEILHQYQSFEL
jgi:hypothetical protein